MGSVYCIVNSINLKIYVGATIDPNERFALHKSLLNQNCHFNYELQHDWIRYGEEAFCFLLIQQNIPPDVLYEKELTVLSSFLQQCSKSVYNTLLPGWHSPHTTIVDKRSYSEAEKIALQDAPKHIKSLVAQAKFKTLNRNVFNKRRRAKRGTR